ncbi:uncharacterized protein C8R40DRAFT_1067922 [Lentinula edodes]|uniref:uncharacterized protein n=1 Tax=Lentinula edodes TaxID=5353 RepID=UPI001E8ED699|nr:uncharacterized protein C8R40DRAFT_1067922 [Lentinula edodes]KAH7877169.1 hypothetical protein C8R40DRAFT_1067922 [Lentinula edodes]
MEEHYGQALYARALDYVRQVHDKKTGSSRSSEDNGRGICPKEKLFKGYIELETNLWEFDCVRKLSGALVFPILTFIQFDPANSSAWIRCAKIESQVEDFART